MMKKKIIFLINPISGTRGKNALAPIIEEQARARGIDFEILPTVASGDYRFLEAKIKEEDIGSIGICGGDGSVNQVVESLAHTGISFGIIPMGSGNGLAFSAGIPKDSAKAIDIVFDGEAKPVDAFLINKQFACMLCGLGFDASVAHDFAKQPKRGLGTYASLTTQKFIGAKVYPFIITLKDLKFSVEAYFISIANSNQFGNHVTIAPQAKLSDGLLDIVIVKKMAKPFLLFSILRQIFSGRLRLPENSLNAPIVYFQTSELQIANPQDAPMHIDGEPRESIPNLKIKILPGYFNLIHSKQVK